MIKKERVKAITEAEVRAKKDNLVRVHVLDAVDVLNGSVPRSEFKTIGRDARIIASLMKDVLSRTWDGTYHVVQGNVLLRFDSGDDLFAAERKAVSEFVGLLPQLQEWIDARETLGVARVLEGDESVHVHDERVRTAREVIRKNRDLHIGQGRALDDAFAAWLRKVSRTSVMALTIATVEGREEKIRIPPKSQTQNLVWIGNPKGSTDASRRFTVTSASRYVLVSMVNGSACLLPWERAKDLREGDRVIIHRRRLLGAHYLVGVNDIAVV